MRVILFALLVLPVSVILAKDLPEDFDVPAGRFGEVFKSSMNSDTVLGCRFDLEDYRSNDNWASSVGLHFFNMQAEEALSFHGTMASGDESLVFSITRRKNRITDYNEDVLILKKVSDIITLKMSWSEGVMYFEASDGIGQLGKYFLLLPKFKPTEIKASVSGVKGKAKCQYWKI